MPVFDRLMSSFRGRKLDRDLDDELAFHIEMKARELAAGGMNPEEARREAHRRFGSVTRTKERTRDKDVLPSLDSLFRDVRFSLRTLSRSPAFTLVVLLTVALGAGANIAVFALVKGLVLDPLPFPDSGNLVMVYATDAKGREDWGSSADVEDWRRQSKALERFSTFNAQSVNLTGEREPERLTGAFVSAEFFELLGARASMGRLFQTGDDQPDAAPVVIASHELWRTRFGAAPDFVGRKLVLNGAPFTVAGVLPADFRFPWGRSEVWLPFPHYPNYVRGKRGNTDCAVLAHVRPGYSREQAEAELSTIARRLAAQYPETNGNRGVVKLRPFKEFVVRDLRSSVLLLWGAVAFVFLIAVANIVNLALSRVLSRGREMGIRAALGASRRELVRQLLVEHVMLTLGGGVLGVVLGYWGTRLLAASQGDMLPPGTRVEVTLASAGLGLGLALAGGIACGLVAAFHALRRASGVSLHQGGRTAGEGRERGFTRRLLVVGETALCLVLLAGAGLLLKGFFRLSRVDPGFQTSNRLTLEYRVPRNKYPNPAQQWGFHWQVVERVRQLPGVRSASAVLALPFSGNSGTTQFVLPDRAEPPRGSEFEALINRAAPGLFTALGIPVLQGRAIDERDQPGAAPVVVISRSLAERYWPRQDPIGRQIRLPNLGNVNATVIGVVGDIRHRSLADALQVQMYVPFAQHPHIFSTLVVETQGDPMSYANAVRRAVWSVDKDQPVWKVRTLESLVEGFVSYIAFLPRLVAGFALFALVLAGLGIYGVVSYWTGRRTREFGLRIAIGAQRRDVLGLVLRDALGMSAAGTAIGVAGAMLLARLLKNQLFGVSPTDPATFASVAVLLTLVAAVAGWLPARRALRVDPVTALRHE